jgi:malate dehydrogenase (oxaloacetate-decarboxylating)
MGFLVGDDDELVAAKVTETLQPTALISTSSPLQVLEEELVRSVTRHVERPAIIVLSAPDAPAAARVEEVRAWTGSRAFVATAVASATWEPAYPVVEVV